MVVETPRLTKVIINGVDVSSPIDYVISWEHERNWLQSVSEATIILSNNVKDVIDINEDGLGVNVTIQRGASSATEEYVFRGEVLSIEADGGAFVFHCKDNLYEAVRSEETKSFDINIDTEAGVISEIFKTLINDNTTLTANNTSVTNSGTTNTLTKFVCNNAEVFESCQRLAKTLNWQFFYSHNDDLVYFQPKGAVTSSITLETGDNIVETPKWIYNNEKLVNHITVRGAEQEVERTEYFDGDGNKTEFELAKTPVSVKIWVGSGSFDPANGTFPSNDSDNLQEGGKEGATSGSFDYEVDPETLTITFQSGSVPPSGTNNIEVGYSFMLPSPVVATNPTSITSYGEHKKTIYKPELKNISDAEEYADNEIDKFGEPFIFCKDLKVSNVTGLNPGELVRVIDDVNDEDRFLLITQMKFEYPYRHDKITVGDEVYKTNQFDIEVEDRVRRLEEEQSKTTDLLLHIISLNRRYRHERRDFRLEKHKIYDSFILNHRINGRLSMGQILDDMESSSGNWTSANSTLGDDSSTTIVGSGSLSTQWNTTGTITLRSTQSFGDVSNETGTNSGTPTQGTVGVWIYSPNNTCFTDIKLRIGNEVDLGGLFRDDYIECSGREYASVDGYHNWGNLSFGLNSGWNYYLFDLDNPDDVLQTPDWTSVNLVEIIFTVAEQTTVYVDYLTISKSNYIGLNGLGDRIQSQGYTRIVPGNNIFREYIYDEDYVDNGATTATVDTTNNEVAF